MFCMTMSTLDADVLILGGGVAGLAAAKSLRKNGINNYIILEGSERLGGRVHSTNSAEGHVLELGAGWIHGSESFALYEIATESKLKLNQTHYCLASARDDRGNNLTYGLHQAYDKLTKFCDSTWKMAKRMKGDPEEPDISHQKALELSGWKAKTLEEKCAEYLVYDFFYGMDNDKISTRFSFEYDLNDPQTADFRVVDSCGLEGLIQYMCDIDDMKSPTDSRILLNQVVTNVKYSDQGVAVEMANGFTFTAKYAILTFSLGVLKSDSVSFKPPLPIGKQQSIQKLAMLNYLKVFVVFSDGVKPFWDCTEMIVYCSERKHYFTIWENLQDFGGNILVGTLMDNDADAALLWSSEELKENVIGVLRNMYGDQIPEPKWIRMTTWATDPLFCGSFSGRPVGFSKKDSEEFHAPVGRLHFAGEAYSDDHYGDVYGAYSTGLEEGATVASALLEGKSRRSTNSHL